MAWLLALGLVIGLVVWLASFSVRRRRIGWIVASGCLPIVLGTLAFGLALFGWAVGCGYYGACGDGFMEFLRYAFSTPGGTTWMLLSGGLVLLGIGLWVYAIYLDVRNLGEWPTRPASRR